MAVTCSQNFTVSVDDEGQVWMWGNIRKALVRGILGERIDTPTMMEGVRNVQGVAVGEHHMACVDNEGHVWTYGDNYYVQLGIGDLEKKFYDSFHRVESLENVKSVACSDTSTLCLLDDGTVYGFGCNDDYELGVGDQRDIEEPTQMHDVKDIVSVACGNLHSILLDSHGDVYVCGYNNNVNLGLGDNTKRNTPVKNPFLSDIVQIACGGVHTLALNSNNELYTFGNNFYGQLGLGHYIHTMNKPTLVVDHPPIHKISCGYHHSMIIDVDGYLWVCGSNHYG